MTELRSLDAEIAARRRVVPPGADPRGRIGRAPPHMRPLPLRIGTRGSPLALWQTRHFRTIISGFCPVLRQAGVFEEDVIATSGDRIQDRRLADIGGKGLFAKELHEALLDHRIHLAVHSMKDLETELPRGVVVACTLRREDPRDALILGPGCGAGDAAEPWAALPRGALVGTASVRRQSQMLHARPDLRAEVIRGNVQTRLDKVRAEGGPAASMLALAGLRRLGLEQAAAVVLDPEVMLPAACQGIVAVTAREDDIELRELLAAVEDPEALAVSTAERAMLASLDGSCRTPIGGYARVLPDGGLRLTGLVARADGSFLLRRAMEGSRSDAAELGESLGEALRKDSPSDIFG